ncbi:MAG: putative Ig domain-containing protein [Kiritimatiellae bacterium]|nr:putative Ig domain-containing protein [Kiritimatiellia bacterium]
MKRRLILLLCAAALGAAAQGARVENVRAQQRPRSNTVEMFNDLVIPVRNGGDGDELAVATDELPDGLVGEAYEATLEATGGTAPYAWSAPAAPDAPEAGASSSFAATGTAQGWREDDGYWELALPFAFPYFGKTCESVWVDSNGRITLAEDGYGSRYDYDETAFLATPTIAVLWTDLRTDGDGCDVFVSSNATSVTVRWAAETYSEDGDGAAANASATLHADGRIVLSYGTAAVDGGFAGFSAGDGATRYDLDAPEGGWSGAADVAFAAPGATLPAWLSLASDGTLAGTPARPGDFDIPVAVEDAAGATAAATLALHVAAAPLEFVTDALLPDGTTGVWYEQEIELSGGVKPYSLDSPDWDEWPPLGWSGYGDGTFSVDGTPDYGTAGTYSFTIEITDALGAVASKRFTLTLSENENRPPAIVSATPDTNVVVRLAEGESADFSISATDPDGDPISNEWYAYDEEWDEVATGSGSAFRLAPDAPGLYYVEGSVADGTWTRWLHWTVYVGEPEEFVIATESPLPDATEGETDYEIQFEETGGVGSILWELESGALPGDFRLWDDGFFRLYRAAHPGDWTFTVRAEDELLGRVARKTFALHVEPGERTAESPAPVPHWWIDEYAPDALSAAGGDYEAAAASDAENGNGAVWECYVAGLAPEDNWDRPWDGWFFLADIAVSNGAPVVTWEPDLGAARVYTVEGKETLSDGWGPTNASSRFFRVKVSLPE